MVAVVAGLASLHRGKLKFFQSKEALEYLYSQTDTSPVAHSNWSLTLRLIHCQCKALQQLSKLSGINTVGWLR